MRQIELLAPAKNKECGIDAINHGADAVYIGAPKFGARLSAGNSIEDIQELITYAHLFNAKVYVALNTIIFDNELKEVEEIIASYRPNATAKKARTAAAQAKEMTKELLNVVEFTNF